LVLFLAIHHSITAANLLMLPDRIESASPALGIVAEILFFALYFGKKKIAAKSPAPPCILAGKRPKS